MARFCHARLRFLKGPAPWLILSILLIPWYIQSEPQATKTPDTSKWRTFASKAGWTLKYPRDWQVGDREDPQFVNLYHNSTGTLILINRFADRPDGQTDWQWLDYVKTTASLNPRISEVRITFAGLPALKVITKDSDSTQSENIYVVNGVKTFTISFQQNSKSEVLCREILNTFQFIKAK